MLAKIEIYTRREQALLLLPKMSLTSSPVSWIFMLHAVLKTPQHLRTLDSPTQQVRES